MRRRRWLVAFAALGMMASSPSMRAVEAGSLTSCSIAGSWVGNSPPIPGFYTIPLLIKESVAATGSLARFTSTILPVNGDTTFGGLFPDADQGPAGVGTYAPSGRRAYRVTWLAHFVKSPPPGVFDRGEILYFWTLIGRVECLDANTRRVTGLLSLYSNVDRPDLVVPPLGIFGVHDQDADDDGFADDGEVPFFAAADFEVTFKRLPLIMP